MMGSMACITMMMQWVMDMMSHTYVSGWKVTVNTENRVPENEMIQSYISWYLAEFNNCNPISSILSKNIIFKI